MLDFEFSWLYRVVWGNRSCAVDFYGLTSAATNHCETGLGRVDPEGAVHPGRFVGKNLRKPQGTVQIAPLSRKTFPGEVVNTEISPLRFASVEVTNLFTRLGMAGGPFKPKQGLNGPPAKDIRSLS